MAYSQNPDGIVTGSEGNNTLLPGYVDANGDRIDGMDAILPGTIGNDDVIVAGSGNDRVDAGEGNDLIYGGPGADTLSGGAGDDTVYGDSVLAGVTLPGGTSGTRGTSGTGGTGGTGGTHGSGGTGGSCGTGGTGAGVTVYDDLIYGGSGNDKLFGELGSDTLYGGSGNDTLSGGAGRDTLDGGEGNDVIDSASGSVLDSRPDQDYPGLYPADTDPNNDRDLVDGGAGDDVIRTGDDDDTIEGGTGNDSIDAGVDDDLVSAGDGRDTVVGAEGNDTISAGAGDDLVYGGYGPGVPDGVNIPDETDLRPDNGRDSISGGDGNDTIFGMDDDDTITGDAGNDVIDAGIDDDLVTGGAGDDRITGGHGADTLSGGDDRDRFVGGSVGDQVDGDEGGSDFDTLDLSGAGPLKVVYDPLNPENGTVEFLDPVDRHVVGSMTFKNIENVIPCFTPGTLIATPRGEVAVENLRVGDRVITRDNGMQEIRWLGRRDLSWADLAAAPHLKPILVRQGSLGNGLPERDMLVSPNHRLLVANDKTALYFDEHEVLVAAKHLVAGKGIHSIDAAGTSYIHFMCDRHEVVLSNGAWTESFQPGDMTLKGMGNSQRSEIFDLFPELKTEAGLEGYVAARKTLKKHEAALIAH